MAATTMLFPNLFPDWNSLDAVRRAHSDLELTSIVFFGLLAFFDVLAHMTSDKGRERTFGAIGLVFFVLAVGCEGLAYTYGQQNDKLSEGVIRSLSSTAGQAAKDSQTAITNSGIAESTAAGAERKAEEARKEADSFEKDIASSKQLAADAESHLADALQRAAASEREILELRKENLELWKKVQPRTIRPEKKDALLRSLKTIPKDLY